ncbi:hypothetical protein Droror1_Dr00021103, partial [Drosera rotundifolia]
FKRPACSDFLKFCLERFDVAVWSSRSKTTYCIYHIAAAVICPSAVLIIIMCSVFPWEKGDYDESNTLLLDDSPYKALLNPPHTAIFPFTYNFKDGEADDLIGPGGSLRAYLEELAKAENAQDYIRSHPFGQEAITEQNLYWPFYQK